MPWCIRKCAYCDFNSHKAPDNLEEKTYIRALILDLKKDITRYGPRPLQSIFIGGGTPSLFSASSYKLLFSSIKTLLPLEPDLEITLEANPGSALNERLIAYRDLGINRLSLGIQTFKEKHLKTLTRIHTSECAQEAILNAKKAGFSNLNLDIMYGLPNQSPEEAREDLLSAINHEPTHLSWYELTIEPNTYFFKYPPPLPPESILESIESTGLDLLNQHGFARYEISAFSKKGFESQHNLNYWTFGDYFGIGAGAHGKLTLENNKQIIRTQKTRHPDAYLNGKKPFLALERNILQPERLFEYMLNATRLEGPQDIENIVLRTFLSREELIPYLQFAKEKNLITIDSKQKFFKVTTLGRRFTNDLQALFLQTEIH